MNKHFTSLIVLAIIAVVGMALVPVLVRLVNLDPWLIGAIRLIFSVFGLWLLALFSKKSLRVKREDIPVLVLLGCVFSLHWLTYFYAIQMSSASVAAIGVSTFGAHLLLLGWLAHKQAPNVIELLCMLVAFVGVYWIVPDFNLKNDMSIGLLLSVFSGFCYALLPIIHQKSKHIPTSKRTFWQFSVALAIFSLGLPSVEVSIEPEEYQTVFFGMLIMATFSTLVAHSLWVKVSTELNHVVTSIIYYLYVPTALLVSWLVLDETMTQHKLIGAGLIIGANVIGICWRYRQETQAIKKAH